MSKKVKIKLKPGKAKIKLKGADALPLGSADLRQLLGATLAAAAAVPAPASAASLPAGPEASPPSGSAKLLGAAD